MQIVVLLSIILLCYLNVDRPKTVYKSVKFKAFKKIQVPAYQNDVKVVLNNQSKTHRKH